MYLVDRVHDTKVPSMICIVRRKLVIIRCHKLEFFDGLILDKVQRLALRLYNEIVIVFVFIIQAKTRYINYY